VLIVGDADGERSAPSTKRRLLKVGETLHNVICPRCGHKGLIVNTDKWRPVRIRCLSRKCDWSVDLRSFWPKREKEASEE